MVEAQPPYRTLRDIFYPPKTMEPSHFNAPSLNNITFELKPQYAHILPKFATLRV